VNIGIIFVCEKRKKKEEELLIFREAHFIEI